MILIVPLIFAITASDNNLVPNWYKAIIWTNTYLSLAALDCWMNLKWKCYILIQGYVYIFI